MVWSAPRGSDGFQWLLQDPPKRSTDGSRAEDRLEPGDKSVGQHESSVRYRTAMRGLGWNLVRRSRRITRRPFLPDARDRVLVHCGYHKAATNWMVNVLTAVAQIFGLRYQSYDANVETV